MNVVVSITSLNTRINFGFNLKILTMKGQPFEVSYLILINSSVNYPILQSVNFLEINSGTIFFSLKVTVFIISTFCTNPSKAAKSSKTPHYIHH